MKLEDIERLRKYETRSGCDAWFGLLKALPALLDLAQWSLENRPQWDAEPVVGEKYWMPGLNGMEPMMVYSDGRFYGESGRIERDVEPKGPRGFLRCHRPTPWPEVAE